MVSLVQSSDTFAVGYKSYRLATNNAPRHAQNADRLK